MLEVPNNAVAGEATLVAVKQAIWKGGGFIGSRGPHIQRDLLHAMLTIKQ